MDNLRCSDSWAFVYTASKVAGGVGILEAYCAECVVGLDAGYESGIEKSLTRCGRKNTGEVYEIRNMSGNVC